MHPYGLNVVVRVAHAHWALKALQAMLTVTVIVVAVE
jgi:hypothetical protein